METGHLLTQLGENLSCALQVDRIIVALVRTKRNHYTAPQDEMPVLRRAREQLENTLKVSTEVSSEPAGSWWVEAVVAFDRAKSALSKEQAARDQDVQERLHYLKGLLGQLVEGGGIGEAEIDDLIHFFTSYARTILWESEGFIKRSGAIQWNPPEKTPTASS